MQTHQVVELKGGMYTLLSLRLHASDLNAIDAGLADKVQQAPGFFSNTPVVIDITRIESETDFDAEDLIARVRSHKLVPVLINVTDREAPAAQKLSLPVVETTSRDVPLKKPKKASAGERNSLLGGENAPLPAAASLKKKKLQGALATAEGDDTADHDSTGGGGNDDTGSAAKDSSLDVSSAVELQKMLSSTGATQPAAPKLVTRPVRSGQQLYARDTDLIIMAHVGPGAEIVADNNIHVYGPLRGRALCGVTGNTESRIFCQSLEAELVSVAGNYKLLEEIPEELFGKPAQIWFQEGRLNIDPL